MIANASPLIIAAKIGILKETVMLYKLLEISTQVYQETIVQGGATKKPDAILLEAFFKEGKIKILKLDKKHALITKKIVLHYGLDQGESETIALALQQNKKEIVMDEAIGRKVAHLFNLKPKGTLRILLELYKNQYLNEEQLKTKVNDLIGRQFRLDAEIIAQFWQLFERLKKQ